MPSGTNLNWLEETAWKWRGFHVTREERLTQCVVKQLEKGDRINFQGVMAVVGQGHQDAGLKPLRVLPESQLQDMEKMAPVTAAIARREAHPDAMEILEITISRISRDQWDLPDETDWP